MSTAYAGEQESFLSEGTPAKSASSGAATGVGVAAWVLLVTGFILAVAAFVGACMLWSQWSQIKTLEKGCSENTVDKYSLVERSPDAIAADWKIQGRDLYSSSHNGHLPELGTNIKRATGFCPNGIDYISATSAGVGITVTPTVSADLNMIFFADHGLASDHTGVTLYGVSLTSCVNVWTQTLSSLEAYSDSVFNDGDPPNPYADTYSSLQIVKNSTNDDVIVFTDMGTAAYYNLTMCSNVSCGARLFVLEASTGKMIKRVTININPSGGYLRQADTAPFSPIVYRGIAYTGTASNQSYDFLTTGTINFYSVMSMIDIDSGLEVFRGNVIGASPLADGNFGADITGTPPVDIDSDLVIYGTGHLIEQSSTISTCLALPNRNRISCMPYGLGSNQLFAQSPLVMPGMSGTGDITPQWYYSPYGVDAWNGWCAINASAPCPIPGGPAYAFGTGSIIVKNQCGQRFVISMGESGTLYSVDAETGLKKWTTYIGPSSNSTATYGLSFDGSSVWFALGNLQKKSYLTLSGVKRCDSMWAKVNAWTGKIQQIIPVPCSRASSDCPAIVPDPFLAGLFPANVLDFSNRGTEKNASAMFCPSTAPDLRVGAFGATAVGSVITTNNLMFAGSFSGHMHAYDHSGNYITSLAQCDSGIVYGGASIAKLANGRTILSWGCGYGTGPYLHEFGDNKLRVLAVA